MIFVQYVSPVYEGQVNREIKVVKMVNIQIDSCSDPDKSERYRKLCLLNLAFKERQDDLDKILGCKVSFVQDVKNTTWSSLKQLLKMYIHQVDVESSLEEDKPGNRHNSPSSSVISGGFQQYLNKKSMEEVDHERDNCQNKMKECYFSNLPVSFENCFLL